MRQVLQAMAAYEADYRQFPILSDPGYGKMTVVHPFLSPGTKWDKTWVDALVDGRYLGGTNLAHYELGVLACPSVDDSRRIRDAIFTSSISYWPDYGYNWYAHMPVAMVRNDDHYKARSFWGQRSRMAKDSGRKVLLIETWYRNASSDGTTTKVWSAGMGFYNCGGGGWDSIQGAGYDVRHMRDRAINVAYMAGNVELLYPPPPPSDPSQDHPLSGYHFGYGE
jgi:hypothetical protein